MANPESLQVRYEGDVAVITFDDGKVNALDNNWFRKMLALLDEVEASAANCLVLKGRDGIFSGGLNIKWLPTMNTEEAVAFLQLFPGTMKRIYHFPKPTIAQVTGHAIAGGCLIACACDRRVAIDNARVAMNEVRVNMTIPEWAIDIVRDAIPAPQCKKMMMFGDPVTTRDLAAWHVLDAVCATQEELARAAMAIARGFEGISANDFNGTKARVRDRLRW